MSTFRTPRRWRRSSSRCGEPAVAALNEALLAKGHEQKVIKTDKVRADTTVVPANVAYPTDSGLLSQGVVKMTAAIVALRAMGLATRTTVRDRSRSMRRRAHEIAAWLRRRSEEAKVEVYAINAEMADIADASVADARAVIRNARRGLARAGAHTSGKAIALIAELERTATLVERVAAQTRVRLSGDTPEGASRIVSLHDPDARPIRKGRIGKPVEFGYKA